MLSCKYNQYECSTLDHRFPGFNFMLCVTAKLCKLDTATLSRLIEFLGNISTADDVSSTKLVRMCQSTNRLFVITENRTTPDLVPWGIPPPKVCHLNKVPPTLTACLRSTKKAEIQPRMISDTSRFLSSVIKTL